ncbi:hypothetical protein BCV69DRAFT_279697 [Microstroma glucosiphilum]|uniref:BZIP domain-containing protein n=1 Tax=Pseudomicrostroma glucosiphilum TaxID=1684307 RepID=A0A316UF02_9BASI|nr:hypothetical protein BCV69DRAFT_279697 [Pseudomicrostroma glucosiphilum]PWN23780.1 hypothetical protein BCV69DRAFT_279697 [Pseudomicrostroma glucosiphilum]
MTRGRKPNLSLEPSRQLQTQRAFRERKAAHLVELEATVKRQAAELIDLKRKVRGPQNDLGTINSSTSDTATGETHCDSCLHTTQRNAELQQTVASLEQQVLNLQSSYGLVVGPPPGVDGNSSLSTSSSAAYYPSSYNDLTRMGPPSTQAGSTPYQSQRSYSYTPTSATSATSPRYSPYAMANVAPSLGSSGQQLYPSRPSYQHELTRASSHGGEWAVTQWSTYQYPSQMGVQEEARTGHSTDQLGPASQHTHPRQPYHYQQPQLQQQQQHPILGSANRRNDAGSSDKQNGRTMGSCAGRGATRELTSATTSAGGGSMPIQGRSAIKPQDEENCCMGLFECDSTGSLIVN